MTVTSITKENYVVRSFQKISSKRWELYVITRVINLLNDLDIEFVCQQYINPPKSNKYYLADLAFPSLKLYLEIDEGQHGTKVHRSSDIKRDAEILEATDWECKRIAVFSEINERKIDKSLDLLNHEIDVFVKEIRARKLKLLNEGYDIIWNFQKKYLPETFKKRGSISFEDNVALLTHRDVLRLFGYAKGHYQRATWIIRNFNEMVWFPKLYSNKDWVNELASGSDTIHQYKKDRSQQSALTVNDPDRIVFAHQKNIFGQTIYKFYGVYSPDLSRSDSIHHYFKRIKTSIDLQKYES